MTVDLQDLLLATALHACVTIHFLLHVVHAAAHSAFGSLKAKPTDLAGRETPLQHCWSAASSLQHCALQLAQKAAKVNVSELFRDENMQRLWASACVMRIATPRHAVVQHPVECFADEWP